MRRYNTKPKTKKTRNSNIIPIIIFVFIAFGLLTIGFYYLKQHFFRNTSIEYTKQDYPHLDTYEVHGIDVSKHNGVLDWDAITKHNINDWELKFVFIRATYALADGTLEKDRKFDDNWNEAKTNNLIRGAYHFYSSSVSIEEQLELFTNEVELQNGDLPPVLDVENFEKGNIYITKKDLPKIMIWLNRMEEKYKVVPIIYTSKKLFLDHFNKPSFQKYRFWIANYAPEITIIEKKRWSFWQHCEDGKINAHKCSFDLNVFNGSEQELQNICIH